MLRDPMVVLADPDEEHGVWSPTERSIASAYYNDERLNHRRFQGEFQGMKEWEVINKEFRAPFSKEDVQFLPFTVAWERKHQTPDCKVAAYIDARAIRRRLTEVVGGNWQVGYEEYNKGLRCTIGVKVEGQWMERSDAADWFTQGQDILKSTASSAFKRAAMTWGIGEYLYQLDDLKCVAYTTDYMRDKPGWISFQADENMKQKRTWWSAKLPEIPDQFLPDEERTYIQDEIIQWAEKSLGAIRDDQYKDRESRMQDITDWMRCFSSIKDFRFHEGTDKEEVRSLTLGTRNGVRALGKEIYKLVQSERETEEAAS